jgi:predicted anti-sigma-YlaC factor YlaD
MLNNIHGMITCKEFEDFVQAYLDDELSKIKRTTFERHLRVCRECRDYLTAYQRSMELSQAVFNSDDEPVSDDVPEDLIKAIIEARKK